MKAVFATREELRHQIQEVSTWIAAGGIGAGMIMSITVTFMPLGMWLVLGGTGVFLAGWGLSWLIPCLWRYRPVVCPYCQSMNQVRLAAASFRCLQCTRIVQIKKGHSRSRAMLTVCRPKTANKKLVG